MKNEHERAVAAEMKFLRGATAIKWVWTATPEMIAEFRENGGTHCAPELREAINRELAKKAELELEEIPM